MGQGRPRNVFITLLNFWGHFPENNSWIFLGCFPIDQMEWCISVRFLCWSCSVLTVQGITPSVYMVVAYPSPTSTQRFEYNKKKAIEY